MLSRHAEGLFWLGRYIERAENVARFISVNLNLLLGMPSEKGKHWEPLVMTTGDRELFEKNYPGYSQEAVIRFLTFDRDYPNSILTCLAAARRALLGTAGWDVEKDGLYGAPEITVIAGEDAHATLFKALGMLGLGRERVIRVPADEQGRIREELVPPVEGPTLLCLQAGNVNSGSFDALRKISERVRGPQTWIHVDAAFGLWAAASSSRRHLVDGLELASSVCTDAHKWLNVPYDSGIALVRCPEALRA